MDDSTYYHRTPNLILRHGAGGVVVRIEGGQVLAGLVKEREIGDAYYVLPKGGIEPDESIDVTARREIHEETGISQLTHLHDFCVLGRVSFDRRHWQETHYGLYYTSQLFGEILDAAHHFDFGWFSISELPALFWTDERQLLAKNRLKIEALTRDHASGRGESP